MQRSVIQMGMVKLFVVIGGAILCIAPQSLAGSIVYDFSVDGTPVVPTDVSLAGTADDWALYENPDNAAATLSALEFTGESTILIDDENTSGNVGLQTLENAALREAFQLSGPGDRLYFVCDHSWIEYGERASREADTVSNTRIQMFWMNFLTSTGEGIGLHYGAGNYNTEGQNFFQAIGNGSLGQDDMIEEYVIEQGPEPNLDRRTVTLRVTESSFSGSVIVDAKFGDGDYQRVSSFYDLGITNFPAGNGDGDENVLCAIGNYSGSGAIAFEIFRLTVTDEDPDPSASGGDDPIAMRSSNRIEVPLGSSVDITINIFNPIDSDQDISVVENIPAGLTAENISNGGSVDGSNIAWNLSVPAGQTTLTYTLLVPETVSEAPVLSGTVGGFAIGGLGTIAVQRGFYPNQTEWQPPTGGWDYIYDPDLGSPEDISLDGWSHDNESDEYVFQPTLTDGPNAGQVWKNPGFIDDGMGGLALRIDDPGNPEDIEAYSLADPNNRKITLNFDLGNATTAVAAFRVRSVAHADQFGVDIPFGYPDADQYNLLGLVRNSAMTDLTNWSALSSTGLYFSTDFPYSLNFPNFGEQGDQYIAGKYDDNWDNTVWHEYWITYNINEGEKATALYVDGELQPKFSFPLTPDDYDYYDDPEFLDAMEQGAFFNRSREIENGIEGENLVFRITFRNTGDAGTMDFDYIALKAGTEEAPTEFVRVPEWSLY